MVPDIEKCDRRGEVEAVSQYAVVGMEDDPIRGTCLPRERYRRFWWRNDGGLDWNLSPGFLPMQEDDPRRSAEVFYPLSLKRWIWELVLVNG